MRSNGGEKVLCENFSDSESEEDGREEVYSCRRGAILRTGELELLAKPVTFSIVTQWQRFLFWKRQNAEMSEDTVGCAEEEMKLDASGKNIWLA